MVPGVHCRLASLRAALHVLELAAVCSTFALQGPAAVSFTCFGLRCSGLLGPAALWCWAAARCVCWPQCLLSTFEPVPCLQAGTWRSLATVVAYSVILTSRCLLYLPRSLLWASLPVLLHASLRRAPSEHLQPHQTAGRARLSDTELAARLGSRREPALGVPAAKVRFSRVKAKPAASKHLQCSPPDGWQAQAVKCRAGSSPVQQTRACARGARCQGVPEFDTGCRQGKVCS